MIEQHGTGNDCFFTDDLYWDCACPDAYVHLKTNGNYCKACGKYEEDGMPDSRVNEILKHYNESFDKRNIEWRIYYG